MISEDTAVITAAILTLSLEVRMASGKENDAKSGAETVEKSWEHFSAALAVAYDLGETSRRKRRNKRRSSDAS